MGQITIRSITVKLQLENVAINNVLPLEAARSDAIANLKCFGASGHQQSNFDGCIYIHYAAPPYSAHIKIWLSPFADLHGRRLATTRAECRIYGGWVKTPPVSL